MLLETKKKQKKKRPLIRKTTQSELLSHGGQTTHGVCCHGAGSICGKQEDICISIIVQHTPPHFTYDAN